MNVLVGILKNLITLFVVLFVTHLLAFPIGKWFASNYVVSYEFNLGEFPGYLSGFFIVYAFVAALGFSLVNNKILTGLYWVVPVLLFELIIRAYDPHLWLSLLLLALGLGLAWLILKLKALFVQKRDTNKNG